MPVRIGRGDDCELSVGRQDHRVSRHHAMVAPRDGGWRLTDSSTRGTYVNGARIGDWLIEGPVMFNLGAADGPLVHLDVAGPSPHNSRSSTALRVVGTHGTTVVSPGGQLAVGRLVGDLRIADPRVGRRHLLIRHDSTEGWTATDEDSRWGTWIDATRVQRVVIDRPITLRLASPIDGPSLTLEPIQQQAPVHPDGGNRLGGSLRKVEAGPGSMSVMHAAVPVLRIGRATDNDIVVDDLRVSRHHAELRRAGNAIDIVDLGSLWGTYVDGVAVDQARVAEGAIVGIGRHLFVVKVDGLEEFVDDSARLVAHGLRVAVNGGRKVLLDDVSFAVEPGQLVAVVGPSGAGKSTLLRALTGFSPATDGTVTYNGRDLYASIAELRFRIGYVPQDDIIHTQLSLRRALLYSAKLRFDTEASTADRAKRVHEVLAQLDLTAVANVRIERLSGGQRKRASVALELLTKPSLLFLDEPTTGLDPHLERSVMQLLRTLADDGRTVLVITHATANLDRCDRVLVLGPGGTVAYFGTPAGALAHFRAKDWADVFTALGKPGVDWGAQFRSTQQASPRLAGAAGQAVATGPAAAKPVPTGPKPFRQFWTLLRRNVAVLAAARSYAVMLAAQGPIVAAILVIVFNSHNLAPPGKEARVVLLMLVVAAVAMGLVNSCREIVRELAIYRRERTVGLSLAAYIGSKAALLAGLAVVQTTALVVIAVRPQQPMAGAMLDSSLIELAVILLLTVFAASALGLAVSALVSSDSAALVMVPVLIVAHMAFANALFDVGTKPGIAQVAWVTPSYWGFAGVASSSDLRTLDSACKSRQPMPHTDSRGDSPDRQSSSGPPCPGLFAHAPAELAAALAVLLGLGLFYLLLAAVCLRRRDPISLRQRRT